MCKLYTYWFVAWGFLKPENRVGFANAPPEIMANVDLDRGRHEIPLYDRATKETIYGLSALFFVLGSKWTLLQPIFHSRISFWFFYPLYQVITYNRRVIAGCGAACGFDCAPDLNRFYRAVYLAIAASIVVVTAAGLWLASQPTGIGMLLAFTCVGALLGMIRAITADSQGRWNIAGNMATVILVVGLALTPLVFAPITKLFIAPDLLNTTFIFTALLLGIEELKRRNLI